MKLSNETIAVLKNFSTINQSIIFKPGNKINTISPQKTIMATATVADEFTREAGIYDLRQFLATMGLYAEPEIDFGDKAVTFSQGETSTRVSYADSSMIIAPPEKVNNYTMPSVDVSVEVKADQFKNVLNAANVLGLPEIAFVGEDGVCYLKAIDSANPSANSHKIEVGNTKDSFTLIIKSENLNILPSDYAVELSSKGISKFEGKHATYYIAVESKSNYQKGNE
jgi:hypothetical protein